MNKHLASAGPHHHERCPCVVVSGWSPLTWQMSWHLGGSTLRFDPILGVERQRQVLPGRHCSKIWIQQAYEGVLARANQRISTLLHCPSRQLNICNLELQILAGYHKTNMPRLEVSGAFLAYETKDSNFTLVRPQRARYRQSLRRCCSRASNSCMIEGIIRKVCGFATPNAC